MNKIICITGASAGFGEAAARKFSENGWNCILIARRLDRLNELKKELESKFNNKIYAMGLDVSDIDDVEKKIASLPEEWKKINVLVNNAGLALGTESFFDNSLNDIEKMVNVNINGILYMSKVILPLMNSYKKDSNCQGHIINIGSIAGKNVYSGGSVYCMTKHAVIALSHGQRIDLLNKKIKVTVINPGAADTEFSNVRFKGDSEKASKVYNGYEPLHAMDVAVAIFYCVTLPDNVCIDELTLTCLSQANVHYFNKDLNKN